ncbi:D-3-phosphoglycerate dehydrogenase 2 [Tilletia horrida]|nr:D-3-phosphoglycerate dehydrogenase 2 [Tilletia horrida]
MQHGQAFSRNPQGFSPPSLAAAGSFSGMLAAQLQNPLSAPIPASGSAGSISAAVAQAIPASTSPTTQRIPPAASASARTRTVSIPGASTEPRYLTPFDQGDIRILLLENVDKGAVAVLKEQGYQVDFHTAAWSEDELIDKIGDYHVIGIRSKTKLTANVFRKAHKLLVVGCFCIGTNQVDLVAAANKGVAVFNSPFANSRSVAELVIAEMIGLSRQLTDRARELRDGEWNKVSKGCYEVRGKTLGIVGYGHIGSQLSVLAESMGIHVLYYDVLPLMPLGMARQCNTLEELLGSSDFVSLHVPELPETKNMIGKAQLDAMKKGAYLINNARGTVVDLAALADALESGHLAGAAVDVFPREPAKNGVGAFSEQLGPFIERLRKTPNTILTPHIGGSTEEAQRMIGQEVAVALTRYINYGSSTGAVNFPEVNLRPITSSDQSTIRICYVHANQPGSLRAVNEILSAFNVDKQHTDSFKDIAYLLADISGVNEHQIKEIYENIAGTKANVLTRLLS